jgi:hypothetical protein
MNSSELKPLPHLKMSLLPQKPPVTPIKTKKKLQTAYLSGKVGAKGW